MSELRPSSTRLRATATATALAAAAASAALLAATRSSAATAVTAGTPSCQTGGLVVWLNTQSNGAAGSNFYKLKFTNQSGHRCTLRGYPGVSAINLRGRQLGRSASRNNATKPKTITLRNGRSATAVLRIVDAGNFSPSTCGPVNAAGLRVFPPNQGASKTVPFPFPACSRTRVLEIQAIR
jgi:hypothetical protein